MRMTSIFVTLLVMLLASGCATIDFDYPRTESTALPASDDTYYARQFDDLVASKPEGESGFYPLSDGIDALAARLLMASRAEQSIDLQYYLIKSDVTGRAFVHALLEAADRGVRVRLLLDDVFTKGYDAGMAGLVSHPNFEMRIFNPFYRGFGGRARSGLTNFGRINRRMHNKSFTVDNEITIIGGRNIADEYFGAREDAKFGDLDVVGIGPVVADVSTMFDQYWNHSTALPIAAFAEMPDDPAAELERVRRELASARAEVADSKYADAVREQLVEYTHTDTSAYLWAPYELVYDSPDKGIKSKAKEADSITTPLIESLASAEKEVVVLSPYFVPRTTGVEGFSELQASGVDVTIVTNSLAANNQFTVHGGYAPSRKPLLKNGVKIYEVRPDADIAGSEIVAASGATATLHTKAFFVDDKAVFIGSFNFDPRSANINTESGVIIHSPELAAQFKIFVKDALAQQTYEVFLNERGKLRWRGLRDGEVEVLKKEPQTTWFQRFKAGFMRYMPVRGQL
jgi:putative cardiolipin synthase